MHRAQYIFSSDFTYHIPNLLRWCINIDWRYIIFPGVTLFCLNNFLALAWIKRDLKEFAALGCLLANLLALFRSFLAAWQSSSNQGLAFRFGNGEVIGILSAAISINVLENRAILSSTVWNRSGVISLIHWSWNMSHFAFLKFYFGILSGTGWSDVFAVIIIGWWSLPNLSNRTSHATSLYIEGWHKERSSKELVWWQVSNRVWTESFNKIRLWLSIKCLTTLPRSFSWLAHHK